MANMKLIEAKTVGAGGVASIEFTSIPQTYTDLLIVASGRSDSSTDISIKFNNDGGANYPYQRLLGTGTAIIVGANTASNLFNNMLAASAYTANIFGNGRIYITNYTSSTGKSVSIDGVTENNAQGSFVALTAGSWTGTAAITSIQIGVDGGGTLLQHSTFYLYGISNIITSGAKAYGGYVTEDNNYFYHTFLSSGTFTPTQSLSCDILVIGGGGGGATARYGNSAGGGGGAGGLVALTSQSLTAIAYAVTVGGGGTAGTSASQSTNGGNSQFASTTAAVGGGRGAGFAGGGFYGANTGGSGGGGQGFAESSGTTSGAAGTASQGNAGGSSIYNYPSVTNYASAGGGGAGAVGQDAQTQYLSGNGGNGSNSYSSWATATLTGVQGYYAGGGGGGGYLQTPPIVVGGQGGLGGGGAGGIASPSLTTLGTKNTGGGGGGSNTTDNNAGSGGSGLVIVRYAK